MGRLIPWPGCETPSTIFYDRTKSNDDSTDFHPISLKTSGLTQRQQLHKFKWWRQVQERIWSATVQCFEVRRSRKDPIGWSRPGNFPFNVFWAIELVRVWVSHSPLQLGDGYSSNCNVDYCWQLFSINHHTHFDVRLSAKYSPFESSLFAALSSSQSLRALFSLFPCKAPFLQDIKNL